MLQPPLRAMAAPSALALRWRGALRRLPVSFAVMVLALMARAAPFRSPASPCVLAAGLFCRPVDRPAVARCWWAAVGRTVTPTWPSPPPPLWKQARVCAPMPPDPVLAVKWWPGVMSAIPTAGRSRAATSRPRADRRAVMVDALKRLAIGSTPPARLARPAPPLVHRVHGCLTRTTSRLLPVWGL